MNITRYNFKDQYPFIEKCLKQSNYIAIDFEMTGVLASPKFRNSNMDDLQTRYFKASQNVKNFQVIQMGICGFDTVTNPYTIKAFPFNFYIQPHFNDTTIKTFHSSMSTLHFLSVHNFDYNRLFQEGIYFLSKTEKESLLNSKQLKSTKKKLRDDLIIKNHDVKAFLDYAQPLVHDFLANNLKNQNFENKLEISIEFMKPRVYKYLQNLLEEKLYTNRPLDFSFDNDFIVSRKKMIIKEQTQEEYTEKKIELQKKTSSQGIDEEFTLFSDVIEQISNRKTNARIVTHNGLLDILHLYDKFIEVLPPDHKIFKEQFLSNFNGIYDTKFMINNSNTLFSNFLNNTDLQSCYKVCYNMVDKMNLHTDSKKIEIDENFNEYQLTNLDDEEVSYQHEAGFDAMMTGYVFFKSLEMLGYNSSASNKKDRETLNNNLKFYQNKLPLGGVKVPFNQTEPEDIYCDKNQKVFHCVFHGNNNNFEKALESLKSLYGQFNNYMIFSDQLEFIMIFESLSNEIKLWNEMEKYQGVKILNKEEEGWYIIIKERKSYDKNADDKNQNEKNNENSN